MARKKRKITIAKALYGKKTFTSSDEFEFYRSYKMMKLDKKLSLIHISEPTRPY